MWTEYFAIGYINRLDICQYWLKCSVKWVWNICFWSILNSELLNNKSHMCYCTNFETSSFKALLSCHIMLSRTCLFLSHLFWDLFPRIQLHPENSCCILPGYLCTTLMARQEQLYPVTLTTHTVMLESAEPVTILSSLRVAWRPHTLSWWASSVFTHSLVFMVHSFTKPSEPLRTVGREELELCVNSFYLKTLHGRQAEKQKEMDPQ